MKLTSIILLMLTLAVACDGPTRIRTSGTTANFSEAPKDDDKSGTNTTTTGSSSGGTTTGSSTGGTVQAGFESCNTNATQYHPGIGYVSICQSVSNELHFRMGFTTTDQTDGTCLVPLYKDASGNSTYLGTAQCTKHNADQVSYGFLSKNRNGYAGYPVNGVMVLKYSGTNAFFQCMQAYDINYQSCVASCQMSYGYNPAYYNLCVSGNGTSANPGCDAKAKSYMANVCTAFKNSYPYIDIRTK